MPQVKQGISYGQIMGLQLSEYVKAGHKIAAISAAMPSGTGLSKFAKKYPDHFFDVGIAEQHAVTFAAGLGLQEVKPYVAIYSSFLQRAYDQVLHDVCIQKVPVTFLLDRAGIVGEDGETHQGVFDLSYLNHMPNISIAAPRDGKALKRLLDFSLDYKEGPLAIRYPKGSAPLLNQYASYDSDAWSDKNICLGKSEILTKGSQVAILAVGSMVETALEVHDRLDVKVTVVDAVFTKPIDETMIKSISDSHDVIVVLEENAIIGGYGSEVMRYLCENGIQTKVELYGIDDGFVTHGSRSQLLKDEQLDADSILESIQRLLEV